MLHNNAKLCKWDTDTTNYVFDRLLEIAGELEIRYKEAERINNEDRISRTENALACLCEGIITANEARVMMGLPKLENGNFFLKPTINVAGELSLTTEISNKLREGYKQSEGKV